MFFLNIFVRNLSITIFVQILNHSIRNLPVVLPQNQLLSQNRAKFEAVEDQLFHFPLFYLATGPDHCYI